MGTQTSPDTIVLAVDLDEVVFKYCEGLRAWQVSHGFEVPDAEPVSWSFVESGWFDSEDDFKHAHAAAVDSGMYANLNVYEGAVGNLWDLSKSGYQINIITSRFVMPGQHKRAVTDTVAALDANRIPYSNISFLSDKGLQYADAYIDDGPINVERLMKMDRFVICRSMPYNMHVESSARSSSWAETREILREKFGR